MIARATSVLAALALVAPAARADDDEHPGEKGRAVDKGVFGIGIILGEPTGVTAKLYLRSDQAIQAAVGGAFAKGGFQGTVDYLFHPWILQDTESFVLPLYLGPGLRIIDYSGGTNGDHAALGLRAVVGLLFDFKTVPLDAFIEVAPIGEYAFGKGYGWDVWFNAGAGVRYYF